MARSRRAEREEDHRPDCDPDESDASPLEQLMQDLRLDARSLTAGFRRMIRVEWLRFRAKAVGAGLTAALYLFGAGFLLVIVISAGTFIANGLREQLGNFGAGFAILGVILGAVLVLRAIVKRGAARRVEEALEEGE